MIQDFLKERSSTIHSCLLSTPGSCKQIWPQENEMWRELTTQKAKLTQEGAGIQLRTKVKVLGIQKTICMLVVNGPKHRNAFLMIPLNPKP